MHFQALLPKPMILPMVIYPGDVDLGLIVFLDAF